MTLRSALPADKRLLWLTSGGAYITLGTLSLFDEVIKDSRQVLSVITVVCIADIGAYFTGRWFKGPKLAPHISPNKTWSGSLGGLFYAFVIGMMLSTNDKIHTALLQPFHSQLHNMGYLIVLIVTSQVGDLLESSVKRYFNVKDSGSIMPGHGGFLDRLDSLLAVGLLILFMRAKLYIF